MKKDSPPPISSPQENQTKPVNVNESKRPPKPSTSKNEGVPEVPSQAKVQGPLVNKDLKHVEEINNKAEHAEDRSGHGKAPSSHINREDLQTHRLSDQPTDIKTARRDSTVQKLLGKLPDMVSSRRGSRKSVDFGTPKESSGSETPQYKSALKHSPLTGSPTPVVEVNDPQAMQGSRRRSSVYNPFTSFERRVSISDTDSNMLRSDDKDPQDMQDNRRKSSVYSPFTSIGKRLPISDTDESFKHQEPNLRKALAPLYEINQSQHQLPHSFRPSRKRSVTADELAQQHIAICFFPEEPDWGDDDDYMFDNKDGLQLGRRSSVFPRMPGDSDERYMDERERWDSRLVYLISLISYSVSFSNVYHFPALVYYYEGLAFIIPYTFFTIVMGYPLHFLVSSLGQYSQSGPVRIWNCAPIGRGIGWSMFLLCIFVAYYQNMYAAYSVVYFSRCFKAILPWQDCDDPTSSTSKFSCVPRMCAHEDSNQYTPAEHYFFDHVLQIRYSEEILKNGLGPMIWTQVLGFFLSWVIVYFSIIQSVRSIGKVTFYLIVLPYFVLLMLLTAGFLLEGSSAGLFMLFNANFSNMIDLQVWRAAAEQVFFELGICQGTPLAYASYCHHRNPTHIDSAIVCTINYFTSMLCAVVVFNILGALSMEMGSPVFEVIHQGPALVYIVYPEALSRVPGAHFWCVAFFLMLFSVCVGTQIAVMETALCVIYDEFNDARPYRWLLNLVFCVALFCTGILLCTANGFYIVHLLNMMAGRMPRLPIAVCMVGVIIFVYGMGKYCEDMHFMLNYYPLIFVRVCLFLTPFLLFALTIPAWVLDKPITIRGSQYVKDAIIVGWFIVFFILIWILLGGIYWFSYCKYMGYPTRYIWKSLNSWGPRSFEERVARTEFSSDVSDFTQSWTKKNISKNEDEYI